MNCTLVRDEANVKAWTVVADAAGEGEIETGFGTDVPFEVFIVPWLSAGRMHVNEYVGSDAVGLVCTEPGTFRVIALRVS